jgi:trafficking protein particle complex subunit 10
MRYSQAYQTYASLPAHYAPHTWTSLAAFMQARRLDTHARLGNPHTREWIETVLAFLKAFVEESTHTDMELLGKSDARTYVAGLIEELRQDTSELDRGNVAINYISEVQLDVNPDVVVVDHPMLSMSLRQNFAIHTKDQDGSFLDIDVRNALPCVRQFQSA